MYAKIVTDKISTFSRNSLAYLNGVQLSAGAPRCLSTGGLLLEEGTTNILPANSHDLKTGWSTYSGSTVTVTPGQLDPFGGTKAYRIQVSGGSHQLKYLIPGEVTSTGVRYSVQVWIRNRSATNVIVDRNFAGARKTITQSDGWINAKLENAVGNGVSSIQLQFWTPVESDTLDFDAYFPCIERKAFCTSGVVPQESRSGEFFSIPIYLINSREGTIEFTWTPLQPNHSILNHNSSPRILQIGSYYLPNSLSLFAYFNSASPGLEPILRLLAKGSTNTGWSKDANIRLSGSGWYTYNQQIRGAIAWKNYNTFYLYFNGVEYGMYQITDQLTAWNAGGIYLGTDSNVSYPNAIYSNVRVSSIARSGGEIKAYQTSGQNLPVDQYTTFKLNFDGSIKGQIPLQATGEPDVQYNMQCDESRSAAGTLRRIYGTTNPEKRTWNIVTPAIPKAQADILRSFRRSIGYGHVDIEFMNGEIVKSYVDVKREKIKGRQIGSSWHGDAREVEISIKER